MKKGAQMTPQEMWNKYKQINPSIGDEIDAWAFGVEADLLADLLKIQLFIDESTCEEIDIKAKIEENMEILKKYIKEHEIYSHFPFKG